MIKISKIMSFLMCIYSGTAFAGTVEGKVSWTQVNVNTGYPNIALVKFSNMPEGSPACATDVNGRMAVSLESEGGKAFYAMALAAQASGKTLWAAGAGRCIGGAAEEVDYGRLKN